MLDNHGFNSACILLVDPSTFFACNRTFNRSLVGMKWVPLGLEIWGVKKYLGLEQPHVGNGI